MAHIDGVALPYFRADQFERAKLAFGDVGSVISAAESHDDLRANIERELRIVDAARLPGLAAAGVVHVDLDDFTTWASDRGIAELDTDVLEDYIGEQRAAGGVHPWPPGRNDPCWCGRRTKYKKCCGALAIPREAIEAGASGLRGLFEDLAFVDEESDEAGAEERRSALPPDQALVAALDEFAEEVALDPTCTRADLLSLFRDWVLDDSYRDLLSIAATSSADTPEQVAAELGAVLSHPVFDAQPLLAQFLLLSHAEALSASDRHDAACAVATAAVSAIRDMGEDVPAIEATIAASHLIEAGYPELANAQFEGLLDHFVNDADKRQVADIAADSYWAAIEYTRAAHWGECHLRLALDARPRPVADIEGALNALAGIYRDASDWAHQYPEDAADMPTTDDALLDEAKQVLSEARGRSLRN